MNSTRTTPLGWLAIVAAVACSPGPGSGQSDGAVADAERDHSAATATGDVVDEMATAGADSSADAPGSSAACYCGDFYVVAPNAAPTDAECASACKPAGGLSPAVECGPLTCAEGQFCVRAYMGVVPACADTPTMDCSEFDVYAWVGIGPHCHCIHDACFAMPGDCTDCSCFPDMMPPYNGQKCSVSPAGGVILTVSGV
jgi:hypothetical protein